jgi:hypothetical protein
MMSEDLGAVAVTAGVNALAGLIGRVPWSQISGRVRRALIRRGHDADPDLARVLDGDGDDGRDGEGDAQNDREQRLAVLLAQLPPEDLAAVVRELKALDHQTEITVHGGKNAINTGSGDQNVTFG